MPIAIGIGVLGIVALGIFLFAGSSAAAPAAPSTGARKAKKFSSGGGTIEVKIGTPALEVVEPPKDEIAPMPTPGKFYRIAAGDTGSLICLRAYGSERPTARWLAVAAHTANKERLARAWSDWFLPRWTVALPPPVFSTWAGTFTGQYAVVYLPFASEVPV